MARQAGAATLSLAAARTLACPALSLTLPRSPCLPSSTPQPPAKMDAYARTAPGPPSTSRPAMQAWASDAARAPPHRPSAGRAGSGASESSFRSARARVAARYDELYRSLLAAPAVLEGALRD